MLDHQYFHSLLRSHTLHRNIPSGSSMSINLAATAYVPFAAKRQEDRLLQSLHIIYAQLCPQGYPTRDHNILEPQLDHERQLKPCIAPHQQRKIFRNDISLSTALTSSNYVRTRGLRRKGTMTIVPGSSRCRHTASVSETDSTLELNPVTN